MSNGALLTKFVSYKINKGYLTAGAIKRLQLIKPNPRSLLLLKCTPYKNKTKYSGNSKRETRLVFKFFSLRQIVYPQQYLFFFFFNAVFQSMTGFKHKFLFVIYLQVTLKCYSPGESFVQIVFVVYLI
jgi:hypothetical protein